VTSGQPWTSSAMAPMAYANDAAASRRRARTPSGSTSTSTTPSHRKDEFVRHRGRLRIYTNDTRHSVLVRRTTHVMLSS
jgi:ribosomal protein L36